MVTHNTPSSSSSHHSTCCPAPGHSSRLAQGRLAELQQRAAEQQQERSHLQEQVRQLQLQVEHVQGEKNLVQAVSRQEAAAEIATLEAKVRCCALGCRLCWCGTDSLCICDLPRAATMQVGSSG